MEDQVGPGEINAPEIGEAWTDVLKAVNAYVSVCARYPIKASLIERELVKFIETLDIEEIVERAREE